MGPPNKMYMLSGDTNIESLPDELLFDILMRLPADYLYDRARLVCRKWRRIIRSDAFTTTHIQQCSTSGLVLSLVSASPPRSIYVTATKGGRIEKYEFSYLYTNKTMASCRGLVVEIYAKGVSRSLHVINPATKRSFLLPSASVPRGCRVNHEGCGIAYSLASMKYKVTLPYCTVDHVHVQYFLDIVTVGVDKSWRHVDVSSLPEHIRLRFYLVPPLSSEGFLHWGNERYCLTLNVETEIFTMSEVPIPPKHYLYCYLSTGRYMSLLVCRGELWWEVWEMRPAESGEWRKVLPDIDLEPQKRKLLDIGSDNSRLLPVGWVKYPEVLAFCFWGLRPTCVLYNLEKREIDMIDLRKSSGAIVHRNSLVWLS